MTSEASGGLAPRTLLLGCGYCGLALAQRLSARGVEVWGTVRDLDASGEALKRAGVRALEWRLEQGPLEWPRELVSEPFDLVYLAPAVEGGRAAFDEVLASFVGAPLRAAVYVSSTSVYGNSAGGAVDAMTPPQPSTPRGARRLERERAILARGPRHGWRVCTLRLPGIYGPGRTIVPRLRSGAFRLVDGGTKWSARIHRDDVAMGLEVLLRRGAGGAVYLLCDDRPFQVRELVSWVCAELGLPLPPVISLEEYARLRPRAASFWSNSNRYDNAAIASLTGFELEFPSFEEGLKPLL